MVNIFLSLIPNSSLLSIPRLGLLRAIPVLLATLLVTITSPLHATTPGFDTLVNYDTAWTFVYDGGKFADNTIKNDLFRDLITLKDGSSVFVGQSAGSMALFKINTVGKIIWQKIYDNIVEQAIGCSIVLAKNGDFIIGGKRYTSSWIFRTDTLGNLKWSTWLWDSINSRQILLSRGATINCVRETKRGTIICAGGDNFTDVNYVYGNVKYDYAAILSIDSSGNLLDWGECGGVAGYSAGGFCIEETASEYLLLSGNQEIFYFDSGIGLIWKKKYIFQLDGVGSEVNNIVRCKMLRDGSLMVAGQAYEGNCWTKFKQLYFDAWWSPISYAYGTNTAWDTAGFQGGSDAIYDFTQLDNGNLVFIGSRAFGPGGIWTFVTDSTGKRLLWEKQTPIPYQTDPGSSARGYSVCATPDGGFTVAGELVLTDALGGRNAMAAHFIPKPVSGVSRKYSASNSTNGFNVHISGARLIVSGNASTKTMGEVSVFDISGKRLPLACGTMLQSGRRTSGVAKGRLPAEAAAQAGGEVASVPQAKGEDKFSTIQFDISKLARGTFFVRVKAGAAIEAMKIVY